MLLRSAFLWLVEKIGLGALYAFAYAFALFLSLLLVAIGLIFVPIVCFFTPIPTRRFLHSLWVQLRFGFLGRTLISPDSISTEEVPWI